MKVTGPYGVRGPQAGRRSDKTGSAKAGDFSRLLEGDDPVALVHGASPVQSVGGILALQEIGDEETNRRKARVRANRLLDRLDELRVGLLTGSLSKEGIAELVSLIQSERPQVSDPQMAEVLDAIELRAQVELAKLEMGIGGEDVLRGKINLRS